MNHHEINCTTLLDNSNYVSDFRFLIGAKHSFYFLPEGAIMTYEAYREILGFFAVSIKYF